MAKISNTLKTEMELLKNAVSVYTGCPKKNDLSLKPKRCVSINGMEKILQTLKVAISYNNCAYLLSDCTIRSALTTSLFLL